MAVEKKIVTPAFTVASAGTRDCIDTAGATWTVIDCWLLAVLPEKSVAVTVMLWVPASLEVGIQVKIPSDEMLELETVLPPLEESEIVKFGMPL